METYSEIEAKRKALNDNKQELEIWCPLQGGGHCSRGCPCYEESRAYKYVGEKWAVRKEYCSNYMFIGGE